MEYARTIQLDELPSMAFSTQEPQFQVVLIYEDFEMGILGQNVFDQITKEVGGESAARLTVWGFDFFHTPELTHAVSRQAVAADVIIVAPRDPNQLPPQVRGWLEEWPPHRSLQSGVLIAIFDPNLPPFTCQVLPVGAAALASCLPGANGFYLPERHPQKAGCIDCNHNHRPAQSIQQPDCHYAEIPRVPYRMGA